ncbi:SDR family NAD(P)-dependent oxidoreductase [Gammaproteobacteria bacterium]|jgi:NAD(P)-dependent dehydrogenase (short-subunit alcohol dehydrogenase family)|nr:SDR family NAD(P)-dependent oxidoreductase [Gammaproteobacteria bacterium]
MATILITGCNRGIGLQLCRQFAARGDEVIGVCRSDTDELRHLGFRVITGVDVSAAESVPRLKESLGAQHLDVLINNAGILLRDSLGELDYTEIVEQFRVNTLGPLRVTEALLDNLGSGSKVVILSSRVGSIEDNSSGGYYGYRASKAAVNMIGTNLKHDLLPRGIAVGLLHPGMVATQMTNGQGVAPADAAKNIIDRIDGLDLQNSGGFWHAEGYELPW